MSNYSAFEKSAPAPLISLAAARADPRIVYHSVSHINSLPTPLPTINIVRPPPLISSSVSRRTAHEIMRAKHEELPSMLFGKRPTRPQARLAVPLLPLAVARARGDIKYRREGFEMQERRRHLALMRKGLF